MSERMGMAITHFALVGEIVPGSQAEALRITPGSKIVSIDGSWP